MKLLVLGSTGLLGQAIVREARARSCEIVTAARSGAEIRLDVTDELALDRALDVVRPDAVVNCAALTDIAECERDPGRAYAINARPLAFLACWSNGRERPLVQISTDHFFCNKGSRRHGEHDPVTFANEYARTKFAGERFALTAPMALVLRTNIVGVRGWEEPSFAEWAIRSIERGDPITLFDDAYVSSIDVQNCAAAALTLLDRGATGLLNLGSRNVFSKGDLIRALARHLGVEMHNSRAGSVRDLNPLRADSLGLNVSAAEEKLGHRLPDLEAVAASVVDQYRGLEWS